jgi:N-acetylmuramoyl-L-alanine amidase
MFLIGKKFGISLKQLEIVNPNVTSTINIGQAINIPAIASAPTPVLVKPMPSMPAPAVQVAPAASTVPDVIQNPSIYSAQEVNLLARLINAEAGGESYDAKVAVGSVVMNRMKSGIFPSTIEGVIFQKAYGHFQFTPVMNGWINKPCDAQSLSAAYEAMSGVDRTKGALYYFDTTTTNPWLWSKDISLQLGSLIFAM